MRAARGRSGRIAAVTVGVVTTFTAAACGTPTGPEGGTPGGQNALPGVEEYLNAPCPEVGTKPATDKEFSYWSMWTEDEPQGKVMSKAIKCFTEKTGVKINVQWQGRKGYTQNLVPALNTDNVPDLFDQDVSKVSAAVMQPGGTQSMDDVFDMKVGEGEKTVKDVLDPTSYDFPQNKDTSGANFMVPYELQSSAWWYNKDKIPDFQPPKTMPELIAAFDKAKAAGGGPVAQDGDIPFYNMYFFTQIAERFVGSGGLYQAATDKTGQAWKSEPGYLKAAEETAKIPPYFIEGWDAAKFPQVQQRWADGEASFLYVGSWVPSETREYLGKQGGGAAINYGSFQFPMPEGATKDTIEQMSIGFSVTKKAKHPEAAKAFSAYMLNKDILIGMTSVADNLVPRTDLPVPDDLKDLKTAFDDPKKEKVLQYDGLDGIAGGKWATEVFDPLNLELLKGSINAQQFVDGLSAKSAEFWKSQG
ncbi:sugar ABC transporter substrate-binding protein [Amycolatopsis antarctica]|uniref:Sugar ABC transporter substrate-binding protein n=1 Tax=Amycolatopsis antarctica TaxID=1854586 RepID=A0A263CXT1_9PSEU|nr:ABC transporter substrate-binding protein [Amycolatopsis antarctica]OZM70952.1 sugar ABC transporter substrate-binding protein [Amycolatopsis antarctica]